MIPIEDTAANLNLDIDLNPEAFKRGGGPSKEDAPRTNRPSLESDEPAPPPVRSDDDEYDEEDPG